MNREIKFRAWHNNPGEMLTNERQSQEGDVFKWLAEGQPIEIMQYTGLKDKNGKEIYEGDIIKILQTDWISKSDEDKRSLEEYLDSLTSKYTVGFENGCFTAFTIPDNYAHYIRCGQHGYIEIIGNIYESPELLK